LLHCGRHDGFVQEALNQALSQVALSPADRRLATQLVYGVLRRRATLDALLQPLSNRPRYRVHPAIWDILRLGAYQLVLLTHIPPHAAVHESVELAGERWGGSPTREGVHSRVKGYVNGILRALARLLTDNQTSEPAADAVPLEKGAYRELARPVLPDPATHALEYLAAGFALPEWLFGRWQDRFGWDECLRLGFWFAAPAPLWLRCNGLRSDRAACLEAFAEAGFAAEPGVEAQAIRLAEHAPIRQLPGYEQGWFAVQDESAMRAATALGPTPGSRVLDLCAAPGGKTTHLAELMQNRGQVIACDVDDERLRTVNELCRRMGITIVETRRLDPERNEEPPAGPFDAVLADVPCSNTGVLGRRPEVRWRLRSDDLRRLVPLQTKLLLQAGGRVRSGGAIVYSTCSTLPEENRQVVDVVLRAMPDLRLEAEEERVPGRPADGGYWARLRRKNS
jgi:16S rRNA (cytosine967-C5)-methyltransferase